MKNREMMTDDLLSTLKNRTDKEPRDEFKQQLRNKLIITAKEKKTKSKYQRKVLPIATTIIFFIFGFTSISMGIFNEENILPYRNNVEKQINLNTKDFEEKQVERLSKEYDEIQKLYSNYELPEEGKVKTEGTLIYYENGYEISKDSYRLIGRSYDPEVGPEEPTKGQYLAVILGFIEDINKEADWNFSKTEIQLDIDAKMKRLNDVLTYSKGYEPILTWTNATIDYLMESKDLLNNNKKKEAKVKYLEAIENFNNFNNAVRNGISK